MIACGVAITSKGRSPWLSCVRRTAGQDTTRSETFFCGKQATKGMSPYLSRTKNRERA